ncbi:MAG: DUF998 domain-containing protein [Euryarchaeota archaeon]|jgi:hypothetical membrane protein|uniref:DUF998 domain-containing protein n=1 Tax=Methanobacterium sp. MZD130B TaxID=3394378 RepID=UPI00175D09AF|nr:DUF998 domain-containing protein [Euryarchaeota archaeon]HHT18137.1 DUF998 domain-containing protein [Methanobacterium sp.]
MKILKGSIFRPEKDYYKIAGILLMVSGIQFLMAVSLAETQYPGYSTATNTLSSLGGTLPPVEPSATIFNLSIFLLGTLALGSVYLILKSGGCPLFSTFLLLTGVGAVGVGLFPSYSPVEHTLFTFITFFFGSLAVLFSHRLGLNIHMVILSMIMGIVPMGIIIGTLIFGFDNAIIRSLGLGGAERLLAYPLLLYIIALGGYLSSRGEDWVKI